MNQEDKFNRFLASMRDATFDDAHWPVASRLIDELCGLNGNNLVLGKVFPDGHRHVMLARFFYRGERRPDWERGYYENYYSRDARVPRLRALPDSQIFHVRDLYTPEELKSSPAYNDALRIGESQNGLNLRMDGPDGANILWATADPTEPDGWGAAQLRMIERLLPHIRHFVHVRQALAEANALETSLLDLLHSAQLGVVFLDRRGRILEANDRARAIMVRGDGLRDEGGFLRAELAADNVRLERLLGRALPMFVSDGAGGSTTVRRTPGRPGLVLHVSPMTLRRSELGASRVGALVLIRDPASVQRLDHRLVAETLGLTPAESRVAVALAVGRTIRDIARDRNSKESTVRWHIKRILGKQGLPRQTDLVRLLLTTPGLAKRGREG